MFACLGVVSPIVQNSLNSYEGHINTIGEACAVLEAVTIVDEAVILQRGHRVAQRLQVNARGRTAFLPEHRHGTVNTININIVEDGLMEMVGYGNFFTEPQAGSDSGLAAPQRPIL